MKMTRINFSKELYSKAAINKALTDFNNFLEGKITEGQKDYEVTIKIKHGPEEQVKKEFSNYVLGMTKEMS